MRTKAETEALNWMKENNFNWEFLFPTPGKCRLLIVHGTELAFDTGKISLKKMQQYSTERMYDICREYLRDDKIDFLLKEEIRNDKINEITK